MLWPLREFDDLEAFYAAGSPVGGVVRVRLHVEAMSAKAEAAAARREEIDERGYAPAWMVALPSATNPAGTDWFNPFMDYDGGTWLVTGELPDVTVSPSIHMPNSYHGYVRDGQVTDDVDGRRYS